MREWRANQKIVQSMATRTMSVGVRTWADLVASGAIVHRAITYGEVRELFAAQGVTNPITEVPLGQESMTVANDRFECRFDDGVAVD